MCGFARTIQQREELGRPLPRYVEMIIAASEQMRELLETLAVAVRIEGDRYDPAVAEVDTLAAGTYRRGARGRRAGRGRG